MIYEILLHKYDIISGIFPKYPQKIKKINNTFQHKLSILYGSIVDSPITQFSFHERYLWWKKPPDSIPFFLIMRCGHCSKLSFVNCRSLMLYRICFNPSIHQSPKIHYSQRSSCIYCEPSWCEIYRGLTQVIQVKPRTIAAWLDTVTVCAGLR